MMHRALGGLALLALLTAMLPRVAAAQSQRDTITVQAGALRFARSKIDGHEAIGIDTTARFNPTWSASLHTLPDAVTAAELSARIGQRSDFVKCENARDYKTCMINGVDVVADFARVFFRGDSASVQLRLWNKPDAQSRIEMRFYSVIFVKHGDAWEFAEARLTSQS